MNVEASLGIWDRSMMFRRIRQKTVPFSVLYHEAEVSCREGSLGKCFHELPSPVSG